VSVSLIKVQPQSAPPDCGFSTSATPKAIGAVSPAGTAGYNYKIVIISQDKFLIIFFQQLSAFRCRSFQSKKCCDIAKKSMAPAI
jgi:hypothetical protein